jgi:hypothetical protein
VDFSCHSPTLSGGSTTDTLCSVAKQVCLVYIIEFHHHYDQLPDRIIYRKIFILAPDSVVVGAKRKLKQVKCISLFRLL